MLSNQARSAAASAAGSSSIAPLGSTAHIWIGSSPSASASLHALPGPSLASTQCSTTLVFDCAQNRPGACSSRSHKHPAPTAPSTTRAATAATRIAFGRLVFLLLFIPSTPQLFSMAHARPQAHRRQASIRGQ
ncbi:hypothetical protein SCE1572_45435 [Sorangium cellulosum So0157-2]|uniref:Uncharacterized protein n=1 Tax=Sorangium cellulosum So0157-2 TaxID=1254432 RepID=S4Y9W5_SORCE|nr:hypothetical protein SCE1572_45435 [Sorangium cellulosum So0157-2]